MSSVPTNERPTFDTPGSPAMSGGLVLLFAFAVGVVVLALYASQPLIGLIGASFGWDASEASLVTVSTLLGYASGLFLLVPLMDLVENRAVILATLASDVLSLAAVACAPTAPLFLVACFASGVTASAIQMLVPVAAQLSPEVRRGRVVGNVMGGLMLGILLSRPAASLVAQAAGWRTFYGVLAAALATLAMVLAFVIPRRTPQSTTTYPRLLASMWTLLREEPVLRRRAATQALCMGAFGVFWTSVALRLSAPPFSLDQTGIALFALAGAAGAIAAPLAGHAGDRGWTRGATVLAHLAVLCAMALAGVGGQVVDGPRPSNSSTIALALLTASAVLLDFGVITDQALGRRAINLLRPDARGRLNGLFTGLFFLGAAGGSAVSGLAWVHLGWTGVCAVGFAFGGAALAVALID